MKTKAIVFPQVGCAGGRGSRNPGLERTRRAGGSRVHLDQRWHGTLVPDWPACCPGQPPLGFPHVPGYQAAGVVVETGKQVRSFTPGDRVFSRSCRAPTNWPGSWWGGHVGLHVAEENSVIKLPDSVSTFEASSLLLAQVGYNGASKPKISAGDVAVVIGEGLVGQYAAQVLRDRGAHTIIAGLMEFRLSLAKRFTRTKFLIAPRAISQTLFGSVMPRV